MANETTVWKKDYWDQAAQDYQKTFYLGLNEYNASLLRFWENEKMLKPGSRILDIGCGVGKYGTYLAELGYDVTLTDISEKMLEHARENMAPYTTPWAVYQCDFNDISGQEPVFEKGFDLTISTFSPAIHDAETVRKMSAMTHGWCFIARFQDWKQPFRDQLMVELGLEPEAAHQNAAQDVAAMIQAVSVCGFTPLVRYVDYNWSDKRTVDEMADYMVRHYLNEYEQKEQYSERIKALAEVHKTAFGTVTDAVNTRVAWIYWKTGE